MRYVVIGHPLSPPTDIDYPQWLRDLIRTTSVGQTINVVLTADQYATLEGHGILQ